LQDTLDTGTDTIQKFLEMIVQIAPDTDVQEVFSYLNQKILKFEDFDLADFQKGKITLERKKKVNESYPISNTDLISYLPLHTKALKEGKALQPALTERSQELFYLRWQEDWSTKYSEATIYEGDEKQTGKQLNLFTNN
jgi:hypothetical protein